MSTFADWLSEREDHPTNVLIDLRDSDRKWVQAHGAFAAVEYSAHHLEAYEQEHGVVFVALDVETLRKVESAWDRIHLNSGNQVRAMFDLFTSINDLLTVDEGDRP